MTDKPANFTPGIHNYDYEEEFLKIRLDSSQLVNIESREKESLNGQWGFAADLYDTCKRQGWFRTCGSQQEQHNAEKLLASASTLVQTSGGFPLDFYWDDFNNAFSQITVPSSWNFNPQKPELFYFESFGVYTKNFLYMPQMEGERVLLRFEGVSYRATVFLNGIIIGTHDGTSTPFNADITDALKQENRLMVSVDAHRSPFRVPMENTDWFNYGGIYRDVCLVRLPPVYIKDWFVRLTSASTITVDVKIEGKCCGKIFINIPELNINQEIAINNRCAAAPLRENFFVSKLQHWHPENPKLYDVSLTLFSDGKELDTVKDRIGFRTITTDKNNILLNGKKIFLKGVCVHEDHFELGKTTNEEIIRSVIRDLKEMNGNYLRLAHYPHDPRFARIADEEGVLLWEEIPVYWAIAFDNPDTYIDAENQLAELILRDRNRASVIIWSIGNENADTDSRLSFMSRLTQKAKQLDESRLVSAACLCRHNPLKIEDRLMEYLDVIGINEYYGWYDPDFDKLPELLANSAPSKPVLICEFGADARLGNHGNIDDLWTEEKQKHVYEKQIETFKKCLAPEGGYIAGTTPWILYDFRCPRRFNSFQEGFNRKGLIDLDRKTRKPAFYVMQEFYKNIKI